MKTKPKISTESVMFLRWDQFANWMSENGKEYWLTMKSNEYKRNNFCYHLKLGRIRCGVRPAESAQAKYLLLSSRY